MNEQKREELDAIFRSVASRRQVEEKNEKIKMESAKAFEEAFAQVCRIIVKPTYENFKIYLKEKGIDAFTNYEKIQINTSHDESECYRCRLTIGRKSNDKSRLGHIEVSADSASRGISVVIHVVGRPDFEMVSFASHAMSLIDAEVIHQNCAALLKLVLDQSTVLKIPKDLKSDLVV